MLASAYSRNGCYSPTSGIHLSHFLVVCLSYGCLFKLVFPLVALLKSFSTKLLTHLNSVSSVVYAFLGCVPILPTSSILNLVLVSFSVTPSLRVPFFVLTLSSKKFVPRHVMFVKKICVSLSSTLPVIDIYSTLPASSFTSSDYSARPTSSPSPHLSSH